MELRHLRYFLSIAEHSNFRIAAEELLVSQPTLSQQMKDLEKELGCPLFERCGRGIRLTQSGRVFAEYARNAMNVLAEGQSAVNDFDSMLRGRIRIGVVQTIGTSVMPSLVSDFHRQYPGIELSVLELSADQVQRELLDGTLDLGVSFQPTGARGIESETLFDEQFVLIVSPRHRWAKRSTLRIGDLADKPLCLLSNNFCTRRLINDAFHNEALQPTVPIEMTSVEACLNVAMSGGLPTVLPELAARRPGLKSIRLQRPTIRRTVCLLTVNGRRPIQEVDVNDMVIRSDCPSPFERINPVDFGIVAERQCAQNRIDNGGWQWKAHQVWAERCKLQPAPTWLHPNGGLYLYGTEKFGPMFRRILRHLIPTCGANDQATDESLIINQLWNDHPGYIKFLPGDFNVSVLQAAEWATIPTMQSFIYHFIGKSKPHLEKCEWRRFDPPELPYPKNTKSRDLVNQWGHNPPAQYDIGPIFTPELAANLLAVYPDLIVTGEWSNDPFRLDRRMLSHAETASSHLVLTRFMMRLGVNARRFKLRIKEDAVDGSTLAAAGT